MKLKMNIAVFAGSFDPFTLGHYDIALRAASLFDEVVVLVASNAAKQSLFSVEARVRLAKTALHSVDRIRVESFDSLTVSFMQSIGSRFLVRGLRNALDFESERSIAYNNKKLNSEIDTVFLASAPEHFAVSSSVVRELLSYERELDEFVPKSIKETLLLEWRNLQC